MSPRAIATQGLGFGTLYVAVLGLLPLAQPVEPAPSIVRSGLQVMQPTIRGTDDPELHQYLQNAAEEEEILVILHCISAFTDIR